ncbi:MAG: TolB family protein [Woeseia sp.]
MKSRQYAVNLVLAAALAMVGGCDKGGAGFTGRLSPNFGNPGGGGGGLFTEPVLAYQPAAGTALFGQRLSGTGQMIVFVSNEDPFGTNPALDEQIFSYNIGTGGLVQLTQEPASAAVAFQHFDITDTGGAVVFVSTDDITGANPTNSSNIFMATTDGATVSQVTANTLGFLAEPQISGNGAFIVFYAESDLVGANPNNLRQIFLINSDGTNLAQVTTGDPFPEALTLADAGTRIAYHSTKDPFGSNADGSREIFVINIDGNGHAQLTMSAADSVDPDISDDGSKVAFASRGDLVTGGNADGSSEVFVANGDGTGTVQITTSAVDSGVFTSGATGALEIAGFGNYVVFGSTADLTGDNSGNTHTIFWASTDGVMTGQPLRAGFVPPDVLARDADNPHINNDGSEIMFDSAVNYSFDSTGTDGKIFTTARN